MIFQNKYINTVNHWLVGTKWPFRGCTVEMNEDGFICDCQKQPRQKCKHIKSVEMGIFGVNLKEYLIEPIHS
jgi:hypothetical protein